MSDFYNPYHFIPVTGNINGKATPTSNFEKIKRGEDIIRHDLWQADRYSGRLVCKIDLISPTVAGSEHTSETPVFVKPYKIGEQLAIPANSLRGMVGTVAESLSQSALRILYDETYSRRRQLQHRESLSAIGMVKVIINAKNEPSYFILPLCMANLELPGNVPEKWIYAFPREINTLRTCMGAYVNGYKHNQHGVDYQPDSFLENQKYPNCFHKNKQEYYYAKLSKELDKYTVVDIKRDTPSLYVKKDRFVLGQKILEDSIISEFQFKQKLDQQTSEKEKDRIKQDYVRGVLYVLGIDGRQAEIPHTKKHERFIPYPEGKRFRQIPIMKKALEDFKQIASERIDANKEEAVKLPFLPKGYSLDKFKKNGCLPDDGDLLYFDLEKIEGVWKVSTISYSALWRKTITGSLYKAFSSINENINLLPWGHEKRTGLTPVEALFGVVATKKTVDGPHSQNLASRVRFFDAKPVVELEMLPLTTLKILSSPKPPAPCLYFHRNNPQDLVNKVNLNLEKDLPNGRKVYLPHPTFQIERQDWETKDIPENQRLELKMQCTPLKPRQSLYFHIDFENLSKAELTLLKMAISPDSGFHHRLGLGKPLGLGMVQAEILGVFYLNRVARYSINGITNGRYSSLTRFTSQWPVGLHESYPLETNLYLSDTVSQALLEDKLYIDKQSLEYVIQLGSAGNSQVFDPNMQVRYPYTSDQNDKEEGEIFKWFVNNDKARNAYQALPKLVKGQQLKGFKKN